MADIFVSYTSSDREWAQWIALELEKLGHVAHVHEWEIKGGDDIYAWMVKRHDAADHVLCVFSDEYLRAPFSTLERNAAFWRMAKDKPGFVLVVVVKPCTLPNLADHYRRCVLFGIPKDAAQLRLRQFIEAPVKPESVPFPGKLFAVSNIPIRVPEHFLGRDDALAEIGAALKRGKGRVAITTLHGMRGVGKTVLAAAYADRHRADYRAMWWVRAETPDTMRADLVSLGVRLGWVAADEKEEPALVVVRERLRHEGEGLLLIYDNAISTGEVEPWLPLGGVAHVLATSNAPDWGEIAVPVEIKAWPVEVGADYLLGRTGRDRERMGAEALSNALGGLPLACEQAAAYCGRTGIALGDYCKRFDDAPARMLDTEKDAPVRYHDRRTVAKTFALAIEEAAKLHPAAEQLITYAAMLAPDAIPLLLFSQAREKFGEPLASQLASGGLDEAIAALRAFALVDRETIPDERDPSVMTETIRLHRLVRIAAAARRQAKEPEAARRVLVEAMAAVYPRDVYENPNAWPHARRLDAVALDLVGGPHKPSAGAETATSFLLDQLASYRQEALAAYVAAQPLFERALAIREKVLGLEHPDTATSLRNLAVLRHVRGDLGGARPLFERALAIYEKTLGAKHPETATTLNNLGTLLVAQDDLDGARPIFERALAIREKVLGLEHPDTATSLSSVAGLLKDQGDLKGAGRLHKRALAIREKTLGPEHPSTATSLNNLALLLRDQGDLKGARPLFERALSIVEKTLAPEHPRIAGSLSNLAGVLQAQGDLGGARLLFERALAIREKALGPEHLLTAIGFNNLAGVLWVQGDLAGARPLYERALAIFENALGREHPASAASRNNLARLLRAQGNL